MAAEAYVVESSFDGSVLAARNAGRRRAMASITKLMTVLVARERTSLDETVVVSRAATRIGESSLDLRPGQRVTVRDLVVGALVPSANDAATALALHVGEGSIDRFVSLMNAKARALGMVGTHYRNPHGLDEPGHVSTARDSAALLRVALRDPVIRRYARASTATLATGKLVESTDNLIGAVPGFLGGKTGYTANAGWSQVAAARRHGVTITAAILGVESESRRDRGLEALLRFGLAAYRPSRVVDAGRVFASVDVGWGRRPVALVAPRDVVRVAPTTRPLVERVVAPVVAELPVRKGQPLGTVLVLDGRRVVARSPLVAERGVPKPGALARAGFVARRTVHHLAGLVRSPFP